MLLRCCLIHISIIIHLIFYIQYICVHVQAYNHFHNILSLFDVLPNFPFTTSETMRDYYLETWYIQVASRVVERLRIQDPRKLGNIRRVSKPHRMIAQCPVPPPNLKLCQCQQGTLKTQKLNSSDSTLCHHENQSQSQIFCDQLSRETFFWLQLALDFFKLNVLGKSQ